MTAQLSLEFEFEEEELPKVGELSLAERTMYLSHELLRWRDLIMQSMNVGGQTHSFDDLTREVLTGELHLYSYDDCCILMKVQNFPLKRIYHCLVGCGDMKALMEKEPEMLRIAKELNCDALSISGRQGWKKPFKELGYDPQCFSLIKEI